MEAIIVIAIVAAFGYFIYRKATAPSEVSTGSGGSRPRNPHEVER